jgi:hypothetical protein
MKLRVSRTLIVRIFIPIILVGLAIVQRQLKLPVSDS